jgi:predicted nucleotidyltransferase
MVQRNQKWDKILEIFYEYPNRKFTVREISKKTKVPSSTVQRILARLKKENFITKENKANPTPYYKLHKTFFIIEKMFKIGLIDFLEKKMQASAIVIFGSVRKGEYDKESDIDLFVETIKQKEPDLKIFEKKLGHNIQLFLRKNINELPNNLLNNVVNGIKLGGYLKIK